MGPWCYIRYKNGNEATYNHDSDPNEWTNLAGRADMAQRKAELKPSLPKVNAPPTKK